MARSIFDAVASPAKPKTVEDALTEALYNHGLFEDEAAQIMAALKASPLAEGMTDRWQNSSSDYPPQMLNILWVSAKLQAVEWIDKNAPQHWARGMFTNELAPGAPAP